MICAPKLGKRSNRLVNVTGPGGTLLDQVEAVVQEHGDALNAAGVGAEVRGNVAEAGRCLTRQDFAGATDVIHTAVKAARMGLGADSPGDKAIGDAATALLVAVERVRPADLESYGIVEPEPVRDRVVRVRSLVEKPTP